MNKENVIEKVKKLLAIANKSNYPEEAMSAMLKAQEFMAKHGIESLDLETETQEKVANDSIIEENKRIIWWKKDLVNIVAENFRCHPYILKYKGHSANVCIIGLEDDVKLAREVYLYAVEAIKYHSKRYADKHKGQFKGDTMALKNDYILGFLTGLKDRFREQVSKMELSLVLVKDAVVVKAIEEKKLKKGRTHNYNTNHDEHARAAGYRQGKDFDHNTKLINSCC